MATRQAPQQRLVFDTTLIVPVEPITPVITLKKNAWLQVESPAYHAMKHEIERHERAMRGGQDVACWLKRFDWEPIGSEHYAMRQRELTWLNFGKRFATLMVGHMMREAPTPDFGTLGKVVRANADDLPSPAELIAFNTDGIGRDGSQWNAFWTHVCVMAVATGFRLVWAHGPKEKPATRAQEIAGQRPYLEHLSPLAMINHLDVNGRKEFAIIRRWVRDPSVTSDGSWDNHVPRPEYVLLVRQGCHRFDGVDPLFALGGWFTFDAQGNFRQDESGFWQATNGEIPLYSIFYERLNDKGTPVIARSGIAEMVNSDISYMNQASAADYETFDAGTSVKALLNVDDQGFNLFSRKVKAGSKFAPLNNIKNPDATASIADASGSTTATAAFDMRLRAKRNEVLEFMLNEIQIAPDSSGVARGASFTDVREPRITLMASELETAQNSAIDALERLWGNKNPTGSVRWPSKFPLIDPTSSALKFFEVENLAGVNSPTAGAVALTASAVECGVVESDTERTAITEEYKQALEKKALLDAQMASMGGALLGVPKNSAPGTPKAFAKGDNSSIPVGDGKQQQPPPAPTPPIKQENTGRRNAGKNR